MPFHDSNTPPLPPAVKRLGRWFWLPAIAAVLGTSSLLFPQVPHFVASLKGWGALAIPLFFFAPTFTAIFFVWFGNRRIKARYVAAKGRLCTNCTYSLRGLPDAGQCPECAAHYDVFIDAPGWERAQMPAMASAPGAVGTPVG